MGRDVNPTNFERIPAFVPKADGAMVHAVIETPAKTRHKYAFDPEFGIMKLKDTLAEGLTWPYDYGFIPRTLGGDGDPLDVLVLNDEPTFSGCLIEVRILGIVRLRKNDEENDRLVSAPPVREGVSLKTDAYETISDVPADMLRGIERFLVDYSSEQGNTIQLVGVDSQNAALSAIRDGEKRYKKKRK